MIAFTASIPEVCMDPDNSGEHEAQLLKRISEGDRKSFADLYDRFSRVLFATAYAVLHNRELSEDVVQEVFIQIWQKASFFNPGKGKPLTWAMTLTRNRAIDRMRSVQRRGLLLEDLQGAATENDHFEDQNSFSSAVRDETSALVHQALAKLPCGQREAIELTFISSLSMREVSEKLGEPLGTIKARVRRGLIRLRSLLPDDLF